MTLLNPQSDQVMQKSTKKNASAKKQPEMTVKLKYEMKSALYSNQFVLNQAADELFVDFSSGPIPDPASGQTIIPIHTRMALSYTSAKRLANLLLKAVESHDKQRQG